MKKNRILGKVILASILVLPVLTLAAPEKPPGGDFGGPGGNPPGSSSSSNISYNGKTIIDSDEVLNDTTYVSDSASENALLVSGGNSTITKISVEKTGDDNSGDSADFYGTNAAILTYNGGTLNIEGGTITTNGSHANAVFAYGNGTINISDATIKTSSNNSGAIMVTGGGTLTANNVTAETDGNSSAPIRSDRGGGTLTVNGGTYISHGIGSPVIYSTADIIVNKANLVATTSEGVVVEGKNAVTLNGVTMEATNTKLNSNSETYKAIFIYQSMSGDAEVGTSTFTSKDSKIINNNGEVFFITNTNTVITLENNEIINNDSNGAFLKATTSKWGNSGSNGGNVTLNMLNQKANGDIIIDNISTLDMTMKNKSVLIGSIDSNNQAKKVTLSLSSDSILSLTADTYVDVLENEDVNNSNIYSNGLYKLYVNGEEVSINTSKYESSVTNNATTNITTTSPIIEEKVAKKNNNIIYYIMGGSALILIIGGILIINHQRKGNI